MSLIVAFEIDICVNSVGLGTVCVCRRKTDSVGSFGVGVTGYRGEIWFEKIGVADIVGTVKCWVNREVGVALMVGVVVFQGDFYFIEIGFSAGVKAFKDLSAGVDLGKDSQTKNNDNGDDGEEFS